MALIELLNPCQKPPRLSTRRCCGLAIRLGNRRSSLSKTTEETGRRLHPVPFHRIHNRTIRQPCFLHSIILLKPRHLYRGGPSTSATALPTTTRTCFRYLRSEEPCWYNNSISPHGVLDCSFRQPSLPHTVILLILLSVERYTALAWSRGRWDRLRSRGRWDWLRSREEVWIDRNAIALHRIPDGSLRQTGSFHAFVFLERIRACNVGAHLRLWLRWRWSRWYRLKIRRRHDALSP